jgi:hypothetical protein
LGCGATEGVLEYGFTACKIALCDLAGAALDGWAAATEINDSDRTMAGITAPARPQNLGI